MDHCDVVKNYEIEPMAIRYYDQEKEMNRHTRVDLKVSFKSGERCLIEIKPFGLIRSCENKIKGVEEYCLENQLQFTVVTEDCVQDNEKTKELFARLNYGECYLERPIRQGFETPLCINGQIQQGEVVN